MQLTAGRVSGKRVSIILLSSIALIAVAAVFTLVFSARLIMAVQSGDADSDVIDPTRHFVVVAGTWADSAIVEQVYRGVQKIAPQIRCAVELRLPDTFAQDVPLESLLEYAAFACADGVIIVNSDETFQLPPLQNVHGVSIPAITVGQWAGNSGEISCISSNYYSIGKTVARSLLDNESQHLLVLTDPAHAHEGVNSLAGSLQENYHEQDRSLTIDVHQIDTAGSVFSGDDQIKPVIMATEADAVLCVTPELTALVAQALIDSNRTGTLQLFGLYQNDRTREYLKKGIIDALITPDMEQMGEYAILEMAAYLDSGYCNSYRRGTMLLLERSDVQ